MTAVENENADLAKNEGMDNSYKSQTEIVDIEAHNKQPRASLGGNTTVNPLKSNLYVRPADDFSKSRSSMTMKTIFQTIQRFRVIGHDAER